ncbi:uncharacterized protein LOC109515670 [Hippocampus comes]|uniref:uncharacterized protein LOC109515670 n=1 Tax=Hippocampus comes TaxID=109280 RepID=UPI00094EB565|nr:PREDICTED: uncharacterized protein LOC109515670 [Hippocampus comes]
MFKTGPRCKADTPLKVPQTRRDARARLPCKIYEKIPEHETEGSISEGSGNVRTSSSPLQCKSHFQPTSTNSVCPISASSAAAEKVDHITSGCSGCQVSSSPRQTGQTMTPVETTKDSSDHGDIWDSSTSSTVLSPETFRHDSYTSLFDFFCEDAAVPVDIRHPQLKNSTLLGSSHAANIHNYQPPNVSTVLDVTSILVNTNDQISDQGSTTDDPQIHSAIRSADECLNGKSWKSAIPRKPISYRKVLRFKTPLVAVQKITPMPHEKDDSERDGEVMFFRFNSSSNRKEFFRQACERRARLTGCCLFVQPSIP